METHKVREALSEDEKAVFEGYAATIFTRMGMNVSTPGTHETPQRWLTALWDMTEGYDGDSKLSTLFPVECPVCPDEEKTHVVEGPIRFTGLCGRRGEVAGKDVASLSPTQIGRALKELGIATPPNRGKVAPGSVGMRGSA